MERNNEPPEFIDAESHFGGGGKDEITFKVIVMRHIIKIARLASVEWKGGYWQQKSRIAQGGQMIVEKVYIPDTREEYGNSIIFLHDILIPHFDDNMIKESEEITKRLSELKLKCINKTSIDEQGILGVTEDEAVLLPTDKYTGNDLKIIEAYKSTKQTIIRKLLQELSKFLKRKDYLSAQYLEE